tara:strand:- start:58 stop:1185 length:1128 start_codon:yes stop_codon:yes gene_type:complete
MADAQYGGGLGSGYGGTSRPRPGGNRPTGTGGQSPGPGPGGQFIGGATPDPSGVAQGGTTAGFAGQPGGGGDGPGQTLQDLFAAQVPPAISTAPVAAAPEYAEIENPSETESIIDQISNFYNNYINNPYVQATSTGLLNPSLSLLTANLPAAFLGFTGINPQFDEDNNLTTTGLFGSKYGGLTNALNPASYEGVSTEDFDAMLNAAFSPDPDSTKGYSVDFDAAEAEADRLGFGDAFRFESNPVFGEDKPFNKDSSVVKDLEKNLGLGDGSIDSFKDFADAKRDFDRQMGGGDGPQGITLAGIQAPFDDTSGGTGTDPGAGADDPLSTYNSFTEAEKNTVDQIMDLGYDMSYGVNYILGGGPVFSYGGGAYSGNF